MPPAVAASMLTANRAPATGAVRESFEHDVANVDPAARFECGGDAAIEGQILFGRVLMNDRADPDQIGAAGQFILFEIAGTQLDAIRVGQWRPVAARAMGMTWGKSKMIARAWGSALSHAKVHDPDAPPKSNTQRTLPGWISRTSGSAISREMTCMASMNDRLVGILSADARPGQSGTPSLHGPGQSRPASQAVRLMPQHGHDTVLGRFTQVAAQVPPSANTGRPA